MTFTPQEKGKHRVYVYLHGMEVKGSPFSLRIGKDVREVRKGATDIFRADRKVSRYKTHEEQKNERRNYYSEREIPVSAPQAPPRSKKKRQSFRYSDSVFYCIYSFYDILTVSTYSKVLKDSLLFR